MITKPMLKPIRGFVEVDFNGKRMYRNIKTGEIVEPGAVFPVNDQTSEPALDPTVWDELDEAYQEGVDSV